MEKHKTCKLCSRKFANGRALGGHMRSHMMNLYIQQQQKQQQISEETESIPSSSWSSEEENGEKCKILNLSDFSGEEAADDSVVLPDKESETESSKNPTRSRRSKRVRKSSIINPNFVKVTEYYSSLVETEPVSSISETSPEEDVAHCLMMLSKDKWIKEQVDHYSDDEEEEEECKEENSGVQVKVITKNRGRGKYRCETCNKNFRSYQALGGHRASHKKIKVSSYNNEVVENVGVIEEKIHECPVCYRVFSSGQALGGHKRSHAIGVSTAAANISVPVFIPTAAKLEFSRNGGSLIDLNLPPPMEELDDEIISQVEVSAVSDDAEFVNPIKH
ncbi:zinc finger protein ZAT9-like [Nicotiana tomentosiformis]|uniref:zinc finger protein ZAT9-like n=1 Tax=Nicotiana tomentosiformis TaxID=4098 RepID=UPI00051C3A17|nr:zinc finger protein ZAT9-like [Nicotiana tomentosiformis]